MNASLRLQQLAHERAKYPPAPIVRPRLAQACVCCGSNDLQRSPAILMPFVAQRALGLTPVRIGADWGLRDIPSGWAHALCNSLCCAQCGHLFLDIRFSEEEMARLYADYRGVDYARDREAWEPGYAQRNTALMAGATYLEETERFLAAQLPLNPEGLKVLDWGGDTGRNTPMKAQAREIHILDLSGRQPDPPARTVSLNEAQAQHYDLVVCSNVLEHIPYPLDLLHQISRCLHEHSRLYLEVPLEELMRGPQDQRLTRKRHWHEHINFFSESSLRALIDAAGLKLLAFDCVAVEIAGRAAVLMRSIGCRSDDRNPLLADTGPLRVRTRRSGRSGPININSSDRGGEYAR
jgi:hypothetical protein